MAVRMTLTEAEDNCFRAGNQAGVLRTVVWKDETTTHRAFHESNDTGLKYRPKSGRVPSNTLLFEYRGCSM